MTSTRQNLTGHPRRSPNPRPPADPRTSPGPHRVVGRPADDHRRRDPFLDNAKFLAILLVVAGHAIGALRDVRLAHALYLFVYTFHMPVFIVITGYLSRGFPSSPGKARRLLTGIAVPYVVFETAYSAFGWAFGLHRFELSLLDPYFLTWFLMALFMWRLSTPVWQQVRRPVAVAVAISLASGMAQLPGDLALNRTMGLLPFYVLGLTLRPEHLELLKRPRARLAGAVTLLTGFAFTFFVADRHMATEWVYWRSGNPTLHVGALTGSVMRLGLMAAATVLVAAFLAVVPAHRTWFTGLGAATLYAYLLHGFFVKFALWTHLFDAPFLHTVPGVLGTIACAAALGTLLCTPPVRRVTRRLLEPDVWWVFLPVRRRPRSA